MYADDICRTVTQRMCEIKTLFILSETMCMRTCVVQVNSVLYLIYIALFPSNTHCHRSFAGFHTLTKETVVTQWYAHITQTQPTSCCVQLLGCKLKHTGSVYCIICVYRVIWVHISWISQPCFLFPSDLRLVVHVCEFFFFPSNFDSAQNTCFILHPSWYFLSLYMK